MRVNLVIANNVPFVVPTRRRFDEMDERGNDEVGEDVETWRRGKRAWERTFHANYKLTLV